MAEKRKRGKNYTADEKERLLKLLVAYKDTVLNKKTDGTSNEVKFKAWIKLTDAFNSLGTIYRTKDSLVKLWEKLKSESKIYQDKRNIIMGDSGPADVKVDPMLEQVCAILGQASTALLGMPNCDIKLNLSPPKNSQTSNTSWKIYLPPKKIFDNSNNTASTSDLDQQDIHDEVPLKKYSPTVPLWPRRRSNEMTEAVSSLCSSYSNINKKEDMEEMKKLLLQEELDFKKKLYALQLETAAKELEIKMEVLNQIKGRRLVNLPHLFAGEE